MITRQQFRKVPLKFVITPTLDAPVLVHWLDAPVYRDVDGRTCLAYAKLAELRTAYPKIRDGIKRMMFARELRRLWLQMVEQAEGYWVPGMEPYEMFEFAPDA